MSGLLEELLAQDTNKEWKDLFASKEVCLPINNVKNPERRPSFTPSINRRLSLDSILPNAAEEQMNAYSDDDESDLSDIHLMPSAAASFFDSTLDISGTMFPMDVSTRRSL
jgi:hypothetical protein